jgi:hypothetical protein
VKNAIYEAQPPIQWVPGALSQGLKVPGRDADHSSPSSAEVKECAELYLHSPTTPSWRGAQLKRKHRDSFTFPFPLNTLRNVSVPRVSNFMSQCIAKAVGKPFLNEPNRPRIRRNTKLEVH